MFLEKNLQALIDADARHQLLVSQLAAATPLGEDEYEFYETDDGHFTIKYRDVFLHDPEQPIAEARNVFAQYCTPGFDQVHLLLGLGLGYAIEAAIKADSGKIVIFEPDLRFLKFIFENIDLSHHFTTGRVWLSTTEPELLAMLSRRIYGDHQVDILALKSYAYLMNKDIPTLMSSLLDVAGNFIQDFRTGEHFHLQWLRQYFNNFANFADVPSMDTLLERFLDKPALVISRGPSLDASIEAIRELKDSAVLIAVGGAIRPLWKAGIIPDMALFYDANGMTEQLYGIPDDVLSRITFLMSPFTQECCFTSPSNGKLLFLGENNGQLARLLDQALGKTHYKVEGGGTVSLIAFQVAQAMGCSPIALVGQDLAMPNDQAYAGGIPLQRNDKGHMALTATAELYAKPETMDWAIGQNGEKLPTLRAYLSFITHFEELARKNAERQTPAQLFNCSMGGANIQGYIVCPLSDFVGQWPHWKAKDCNTSDGDSLLLSLPAMSPGELHNRRSGMLKTLQALKIPIAGALSLINSLKLPPESETTDVEQWPDARSRQQAQTVLGQFYNLMRQNPFLEYVLLFELLSYKRRFRENGGKGDGSGEVDLGAIRALCRNSRHMLAEVLPEWMATATLVLQERLEQSDTSPSRSARIGIAIPRSGI